MEQGREERIAALWRAAPPSIASGPAVLAMGCRQGADVSSGRWRTEPASKMSNTTEENKLGEIWGRVCRSATVANTKTAATTEFATVANCDPAAALKRRNQSKRLKVFSQ